MLRFSIQLHQLVQYGTLLLIGRTDVVAVLTPTLPSRERVSHGRTTGPAAEQTGEKRSAAIAIAGASEVGRQEMLGSVPGLLVDDPVMLPVVGLAVVDDLADVERVREYPANRRLVERATGQDLALLRSMRLGLDPTTIEILGDRQERAEVLVELKDLAYLLCLLGVDDELLALEIVAEDGPTAGPLSAATSGGHLVASSLGDHLTFELCEAHEDVQRELTHGAGRREHGFGDPRRGPREGARALLYHQGRRHRSGPGHRGEDRSGPQRPAAARRSPRRGYACVDAASPGTRALVRPPPGPPSDDSSSDS